MKTNNPILSDDYRHSASRGNDYVSNPSLWLMRNYFNLQSDLNYSMAMGIASEIAAHHGIVDSKANVKNIAVNQFKTIAEEPLSLDEDYTKNGVIPKQMDKVGAIAEHFHKTLSNLNMELQEYNKKYIVEHPDLQHKITYVPDFEYENLIVDTKATQQFPTDPFKSKLNHIRQVSLYSLLSGKEVALLYATDKKVGLFTIPDKVVKREGEFMIDVFSKIEKANSLFNSAEQFMEFNILNTEGYQWDENTKTIANRYWTKAKRR